MATTVPTSTPMTAAELLKHPEFPHVHWHLQPTKSGKVPVAAGRGGPFNLDWEIHGNGPIRLVWIMGLGAYKTAWQRQTKDFGHTRGGKYSCLIFDNRGIGASDKPLMRYSTSEMAKDTIELLDHVGWTSERAVHVIGISMGGMIAQELGLLIPQRIASLSLVSTAAYLYNTVGVLENLRNRINLFLPRSVDSQLATVKANLYTVPWLSLPDELAPESTVAAFPTNGDRLAAYELSKRLDVEGFTRRGFLAQALAAGWHRKSAAQLEELGDKVGRERILVMHGSADRMITFPHAGILARGLGWAGEGEGEGAEGEADVEWRGAPRVWFVRGQGHVLPVEMRGAFNGWVEGIVARGEELNREVK